MAADFLKFALKSKNVVSLGHARKGCKEEVSRDDMRKLEIEHCKLAIHQAAKDNKLNEVRDLLIPESINITDEVLYLLF